ncbi:peptide-methionine (S)-S-oxide reductase [Gymnodinialimonas ceratoperidinii]|uniref:Peptide-methionine (S)-S-oxide reductase n=1 Tax=Gymnodinialimonas ceratoperidinii TaxID=2856823 RepID=A0A8F6YCB2_9RHOB|nr:peptide-methionine (S)-S-oxide reductase [Gymnodinialimonas ceratoperidinii]QXT39037.1 peptide-methionine (S)-S-oxide reductase [Gymnodinialimonas ceratoperidinii]
MTDVQVNPPPRVGFGGGCHWCTEAVFAALRGVEVQQGFISAAPPDDNFSEAVLLEWDPAEIPLSALIEIHLRTHASTSNHKMRGKYRSAIYVFTAEQERDAERLLAERREADEADYVTRVLRCEAFKPSDPRFQNYGEKNAGNQFCTRYIDPKLDKLRADYRRFLEPSAL